eukprot:TRINITY_DN4252_c0_g1_i1.p1 TRINITY_DN4252_c0_g1~~TRINITY_DN4252_c0_g1_i1.p1  ORF type:complete len:190 (-),score=5.77 TRINITY_DN4252_c0_g1_i1:24-593(-)
MTLTKFYLITFVFVAFASCQSPPNIGTSFSAIMKQVEFDGTYIGQIYAQDDTTLFIQTSPATNYPAQLNICHDGFSESNVNYNPKNSTCQLQCLNGNTCSGTHCICLFDNPFTALPYSSYVGSCPDSSEDNYWQVSNGGYTISYCIDNNDVPLSIEINGAGGTILFSFNQWNPNPPSPTLFQIPTYCKC